jgi:hypothetical protein
MSRPTLLTSKLWIARKCSYPEIPDSDVKRIDPDKVQKMEEDQNPVL